MAFTVRKKSLFFLFCAVWVPLQVGVVVAQPAQTMERDQIATLDIESSSPHPTKIWPLPIGGRLPVFESANSSLPSLSAHRVYSVQECMQIAIANHGGLQVARKQIELALAKLNESNRALFPSATFRTTFTQGETKTAPFKEEEFIFKIEQPLLDGGGLKATFRQAQVNLEMTRANYDKMVQDLRFEVEKNYYELVKLLLQFDIQREVLSEMISLMELTKKQLDVEVITRLEYLNVQSLYQQLFYQNASTEKDIILSRMNLQHSMSVSTEAVIHIDYHLVFPEFKKSLEECQGLAKQKRPEILTNYLLIKFYHYGKKIVEAKKHWKVDLSSSYGSSGSAFEGENFSLGDDFFVGLQVSRPIGLHSLTSSVTTQQTSPKLGESDRTKSTAASTEVGLFNQYSGISEEKEAEVSYRQALMELDKIKSTVESEVTEAYFNGQKAAVLYEAQKMRVEFRERGLAVVQLQQRINEALISNVLEAQIQLAQEQIAFASALADYHISLASLNRSTGYAL